MYLLEDILQEIGDTTPKFQENKLYSWNDLPTQVKEDVISQYSYDDEVSEGITKFKFKFKFLNKEQLENIFKQEMIDPIQLVKETPELMENIKEYGVKYPAVGETYLSSIAWTEGKHRMAVCYVLEISCPYFEII